MAPSQGKSESDSKEEELLSWSSYREKLHSVATGHHNAARRLPRNHPSTWTSAQVRLVEDSLPDAKWDGTKMRKLLRPEDSTEAPMMRIEGSDGIIVDWNRAMADLTGVATRDVEGRSYAELLRLVVISDEYRAAAIEHVRTIGTPGGLTAGERNEEWAGSGGFDWNDGRARARELFPLPLPVKQTGGDGEDGYRPFWVELFVKRATDGVPVGWGGYKLHKVGDGWLSGREFTLRRSAEDSHPPAPPQIEPSDKALWDSIASCKSSGEVRFLQEAFDMLRRLVHPCALKYRKGMRLDFSSDWRNGTETVDIYRRIYHAVKGPELFVESYSGSGRNRHLQWQLEPGQDAFSASFSFFLRKWLETFSSALGEACKQRPGAFSYEASLGHPACLPQTVSDDPSRTALTLKIEVVPETGCLQRNRREDWEESGAKWAIVKVPATLTLFQLHRVVIQTMLAGGTAGGLLHQWNLMNPLDVSLGSSQSDRRNIKILDHTNEDSWGGLEGNDLRQRVALDGAFVDHPSALKDDSLRDKRDPVLTVCSFRYCVGAFLYRRGASIGLEDGFTMYGQDYRITLQNTEVVAASSTSPPSVRCLRGKAFRGDETWSVSDANCELEQDKYLLEDISRDNEDACSFFLPWCNPNANRILLSHDEAMLPRALGPIGGDLQPVAFKGEPPLPSEGDNFMWYLMDDPELIVDNNSKYKVREDDHRLGGLRW